jgi:pimeloyl-ACP methyl ester carboxylesterase
MHTRPHRTVTQHARHTAPRVAAQTARTHTVIAPDLPGHGLSDPGRGLFTASSDELASH